MKWWYAVDNQRFGPVEQERLFQMAAEGGLKPADLVWNETMGDQWARADSVPGLFAAAAIVPPAMPPPVGAFPGGRGDTPNRDLMRQARESLKGNWAIAIVTTVLYGIILMAIEVIPLLGFIAGLILSGPLILGLTLYFVKLVRRLAPDVGVLFSGFDRFGVSLGAYLLMVLFIFLWALPAFVAGGIYAAIVIGHAVTAHIPPEQVALLLPAVVLAVVPIVIVQLRYAMTFYILVDRRDVGPMEAIDASIELMKNRKWKLFCLGFRFVGWAFLCLFTFGIGFLWLGPYVLASYARFYDDIRSA